MVERTQTSLSSGFISWQNSDLCNMIEIEGKIVSREILEEEFVCDLGACKGACCVDGEAGAPLEEGEASTIESLMDKITPFMDRSGRAAVRKEGVATTDADGDQVTPLVNGGRCAFSKIEKGVAFCSIEKAWAAGETQFKKPVSCHLYPIRITRYKNFDALNYERWKVCKPACACGSRLKVPVFRFLKEALIRKYGLGFYNQLEEAAKLLKAQKSAGTDPVN
jgi:hypothetical protein